MQLNIFFENIKNQQQNEVFVKAPVENIPSSVPFKLFELYEFCNGIRLPFGYVFDIRQGFDESKNSPFSPNWFVFGKDNYFSLWLCSYEENEDGLSFTTWGHKAGNDDIEAVWENVIEFFKELYDEFLEEV